MNRLLTAIIHAWLALGRILNTISTTILLTLVFFLLVLPIGLIRRLTGADPLRLKQFRKSRGSVLFTRDHTYSKNDLQNLF
jgi:hypothetical protein